MVFLVSPYREWGGDRFTSTTATSHHEVVLVVFGAVLSRQTSGPKKQKENRTEGIVGKMLGSLLTTHKPKANAEESHVTEIECGLK